MPKSVSSHERLVVETPQSRSSNRSFGVVFAVVFALFGLWPLVADEAVRWWALGLSAAFLGLALARPAVLQPLNRLWTKFGLLLHRLTNPVIMAVLFFLTIVPLGLIMRVLGKDSLFLIPDPQAKSYWIEREPPGPDPETMPNQF